LLCITTSFLAPSAAPLILPAWRDDLHAYLGGVVRGLGGIADEIGGVADHVHLLIGLRATHRLADVLREVKSESSRWVHETHGEPAFAWQDGYGAFTVGAPQREDVRGYIQRQEMHHRTLSFRDEYENLLRRAGVAYEARFLD
jgi:putative transposase